MSHEKQTDAVRCRSHARSRGQRVVGTLLTKVDGKWVEVEFASHNSLAKTK
ncbi:MAG TPA: hypothetical protein VKB93_20390 [Thermoanaerobaculia bacterium]|nr:hypothetical protein [Thermoanaerobaculia bacterium]